MVDIFEFLYILKTIPKLKTKYFIDNLIKNQIGYKLSMIECVNKRLISHFALMCKRSLGSESY